MPKKNNTDEKNQKSKSKRDLFKKGELGYVVGIILVFLVIAGGVGGGFVLHLSNTSPEFCGSCHVMEKNVNSYLTSNHMDNVHFQAGVQCKDCHDYPVSAEIASGFNFLVGNYSVGPDGELIKVKYDDQMCLDCHISYPFMARATEYLMRNPHNNHNGELPCQTCHLSHDSQIDFCSGCHENGGQRMIETASTYREVTN